jgi:fluoroquinolone transport system permease protein
MIFSDPAAMGLYFMGAIVLFEKSERVLSAIAVSPVKPREYVLSKLCSIGIVSAAAGL